MEARFLDPAGLIKNPIIGTVFTKMRNQQTEFHFLFSPFIEDRGDKIPSTYEINKNLFMYLRFS